MKGGTKGELENPNESEQKMTGFSLMQNPALFHKILGLNEKNPHSFVQKALSLLKFLVFNDLKLKTLVFP